MKKNNYSLKINKGKSFFLKGSNEISNFNSSSYSKEELVAEIGAAFLNNHTGVLNEETLTDSSAYIQGWLNKLRNDKKFIIEASGKAQKAVNYILFAHDS